MKEDNSLIRIPLQFFGSFDDDFDDDLDYEDEVPDYEDDENDDTDGVGGEADADEENVGAKDAADEGGAKTDHADLIADLKALGFTGDDLDSIKESVKARRAAKEKNDAHDERKAAQSAGKAHIKGAKPRQSTDGGHAAGISERRVRGLSESMKCTNQRARTLLEKHSRLINGG